LLITGKNYGLEGLWLDGGTRNNAPIRVFDNEEGENPKTLGIRLSYDEKEYQKITNILELIRNYTLIPGLFGTGESDISSTSGYREQTIVLDTGSFDMWDFNPNADLLNKLLDKAKKEVLDYFDSANQRTHLNTLDNIKKNFNIGAISLVDHASANTMDTPISVYGYEVGDLLAYDDLESGSALGGEDFAELIREKDGTGNVHFNHFISYFKSDLKAGLENEKILTEHFQNNFKIIFNKDNIVGVETETQRYFKEKNTMVFTLGGDSGNLRDKAIGAIHDDWVSVEFHNDKSSFFARTLKRNFPTNAEKIIPFILSPSPLNPLSHPLAGISIDANRHHFLAGRRSWKIGYEKEQDRFFIETAGMERYSLKFHDYIEGIADLRGKIEKIWSILLSNYLQYTKQHHTPITNIPQLSGYKQVGNVFFKSDEASFSANPQTPDWFKPVLDRHPGLTVQ
jgi:hypothetical protein